MKKTIGAILLLTLVLFVMSACTKGEEISGIVIISDGQEVMLSVDVTLDEKNPSATDAIIKACQDNKMAYSYSSGMFDGFGGKMSTMTDGWLLYVNAEQAQVGAADVMLSDGFTVEFRYENYDEAFSM